MNINEMVCRWAAVNLDEKYESFAKYGNPWEHISDFFFVKQQVLYAHVDVPLLTYLLSLLPPRHAAASASESTLCSARWRPWSSRLLVKILSTSSNINRIYSKMHALVRSEGS